MSVQEEGFWVRGWGFGVVERGKSEARKGKGEERRRGRSIQACSCIITWVLPTAYCQGEWLRCMRKGWGKEEFNNILKYILYIYIYCFSFWNASTLIYSWLFHDFRNKKCLWIRQGSSWLWLWKKSPGLNRSGTMERERERETEGLWQYCSIDIHANKAYWI